jgi:branched-chain amino acid transport system permease protein
VSEVKASTKWRNPLFLWGAKDAIEELPTIPFHSHQKVWHDTRESKTKLFQVGRLRYYYKWPGHGILTWHRLRYWPTRRRMLRIRGEYNPKSLRREKTIVDKRPIWWVLGLLLLALGPLFTPIGLQSTLLTAGATFGIYAAISLCWMLVIGTAGIISLASYAVVGTAAFVTALLSIKFGLPWWLLPPAGAVVGLIFGGIIALPATRLDGFYYALLTLGLNELSRVYFSTSRVFGAAQGGLYGAATYVPEDASQLDQLLIGYYACFALLMLALLFYRLVDGRRLGRILRMAPEKREAFAEAAGVNFREARVRVFIF